jgi:DNA-directed RNA polymerase I, II, and III subunit RPABC2
MSLTDDEQLSEFIDTETIDETVSDLNDPDDIASSILSKINLDRKYEIVSNNKTYDKYYSKNKSTKPFLTKYEKAKLLGVRAQMLANGSQALVEVPVGMTSTIEIAELELKEKKIPLMIRRYLPDKTSEDWRLEDLIF